MFNTVIISGRLTADPELKNTNSGLSVTSFTIANDVGYGDKKKTNFIRCTAWRGTAEVICKYFQKGSMIGIEGQIQVRSYEDKEGNKREAVEVVANNIQFMEGKKDSQKKPDDNNALNSFVEQNREFITIVDDSDLPF